MSDIFIEELGSGDCFILDSVYYVLSIDHKKDGSRSCISLRDGTPRWFKGNSIVDKIQIYTMDKDNNIIPLKETIKDDTYQTQNIP
jgi:hypothetical protein